MALGQPPRERRQQRLAPALVAQAHTPHVAVELAARDEVAQRELPDHLRAAVLDRLGLVSSQVSHEGISSQPRRMPGARRLLAEPM